MSECQELSKDFRPTLKKKEVNPDDILAKKKAAAIKQQVSAPHNREPS